MSAETEKLLTELIEAHGIDTVRRHLSALLPKAKWADWQRLDSWITNTANRMRREISSCADSVQVLN